MFVSSETSTAIDVVEAWPMNKFNRYFDAAIRLRRLKNGAE
ncbi:hypothetical protein J2X65_004608 [Ancylobacter sp. 3268]|nr:hypothetical protein [Ancylobacter sp. 3268]MDR6955229.1 hypothetical protein [Ancylobacter sp. 3268]